MKRKGEGTGRTQPIAKFAAATESRFTECPICGRSIALATANWHIDECLQAQAAAHQAAAEPPPPQQLQQAALLESQPPAAPQPPVPAAPCMEEQQQAEEEQQQAQPPPEQQAEQLDEEPPEERHPGRRPGKEPVMPTNPPPATPGPPFLRPSKAGRVVATSFRQSGSSGRAEEGLTADGLFATAACELVTGFLPPELAEQLLERLQQDASGWEQQTWWIGERSTERPGLSSKTSCHYLLGEVRRRGS